MKPHKYQPATAPDFKLAKMDKLSKGDLVHVEGWPKGCVFKYQGTTYGCHSLKTPKTGKLSWTTNRLLLVREK